MLGCQRVSSSHPPPDRLRWRSSSPSSHVLLWFRLWLFVFVLNAHTGMSSQSYGVSQPRFSPPEYGVRSKRDEVPALTKNRAPITSGNKLSRFDTLFFRALSLYFPILLGVPFMSLFLPSSTPALLVEENIGSRRDSSMNRYIDDARGIQVPVPGLCAASLGFVVNKQTRSPF